MNLTCPLLSALIIHGISSIVEALYLWDPSWPLQKITASCRVKTTISFSTLRHSPLRYRNHCGKKKLFGAEAELFFTALNLKNELPRSWRPPQTTELPVPTIFDLVFLAIMERVTFVNCLILWLFDLVFLTIIKRKVVVSHQERLLQKAHHHCKAHCRGSVEDQAVCVNSKYPEGANKNMQISFKSTNLEREKYNAVPPRDFQLVCYFCCSPSSATHERNQCWLRKDWKSYHHICPTWSTVFITLTVL